MIRIGLNNQEKQQVINEYLANHDIKKVYVFYPEKFPFPLESSVATEHIEYGDIIMYKFFYRLLEEINDNSLLIFNECLRTQKRSDLTYNCAHHYCNQTSHKIVFEYFPFIEQYEDFMILLDFLNKGRYKGKGFDFGYLREEDVRIKPNPIKFNIQPIPISPEQIDAYEQKKEKLFAELGNKEPDTIPRNLHVFAGGFKKPFLQNDKQYVARNSRFNLSNVVTYRPLPTEERIVIDFPHRRLDFNDYLKNAAVKEVTFISTELPVDNHYAVEFENWLKRVGDFIAQAGLCK